MEKVAVNIVKGLVLFYVLYVLIAAPLYAGGSVTDSPALAIALILAAVFAALQWIEPTRLLLDTGLAAGRSPVLGKPKRTGKRNVKSAPRDSAPQRPERKGGTAYLLLGLAILAACLIILERHQPFFFTQDDNLAQNLPLILQGCHSLFHGVFCTWNPYQLFGAPTATIPTAVLTYLPTYIAYFIANNLLGNEYATLEVLSIGHVLFAYLAMYWLGRCLSLRPALSTVGALSLALSGYVLILGRSTGNAMWASVWMIVLAASVVKLQREPVTWKWALWTGLAIGIPAHAGYGQVWVYSLMFYFFALAALISVRSIAIRKALWVIPAVLVGLSIALPLLVPQALETTHLYAGRQEKCGEGIQQASPNLLLPYPLAKLGPDPEPDPVIGYGPIGWGSVNYELMGQYYYSGTFFCLVALLLLLFSITYRWNQRIAAENVWLVCTFVALLCAIGIQGGIWKAFEALPVFCKFRGPFKFLWYLNLFAIMGGGVVMERLLRTAKQPKAWEGGIGIVVSALLIYHCALPLPAFYSYGDKPYPSLPSRMAELIVAANNRTPQRVKSLAPIRSPAKGYALGLYQDFATVYQVIKCEGYDPLVDAMPENKKAMAKMDEDFRTGAEAYGVRWFLMHRLLDSLELSPNRAQWIWEHPQWVYAKPTAIARLKTPDVEIWDLGHACPMAFPDGHPEHALPIEFNGAGVRIETSSLKAGGKIIVNFLKRPWTVTIADGRRVPCSSDEWGRITVSIPPGSRGLEAKYSPPWAFGFIAGGAAAALAAIAWWALAVQERRAHYLHRQLP